MLIGEDVADDARRRLELVEFLVDVLRINALQVTFQGAVAGDAACGRQRSAPDRELLAMALHDLALSCIPGDEVTHVLAAWRRKHRQRCPYIGLAGDILDRERFIVHADVVGRHIK